MTKQLDIIEETVLAEPIFDAAESERRKLDGMKRVSRSPFVTAGLDAIWAMPTGLYTGEDIRFALMQKGITPHHPNGWGALIGTAKRAGLLEETDQPWVKAASKKSHSSRYPIYLKAHSQ